MKNVSAIKMACGPDLMVNMVVNDSAHIARAKAKAARVQRARCRAAENARTDANVTAAAGFCAGAIGLVSMLLALTMV